MVSKCLLLILLTILFSSCSEARSEGLTAIELSTATQFEQIVIAPVEWHNRTVEVQIYPYGSGQSGFYIFCLEPCTRQSIEETPFSVYTRASRFGVASGEEPFVVRIRLDAGCFTGRRICVDLRFFPFYEEERELP